MAKKKTIEEIRKVFEDAGCILLSNEYINSATHLNYICICGRESYISFNNFRRGSRCKKCATEKMATARRYTYEHVYQTFIDAGCFLLSTDYINTDETLDYICSCGNESRINFTDFRQGHRCRNCGIKKCSASQRFTYEEVQKEFDKGGCVLLSTSYQNIGSKLEYLCNCGKKSFIRFGDFKKGQRCYECRNEKIAKTQLYSYEYVIKYFEKNGCKLVSTNYIGNKIPMEYICNCGAKSRISFSSFSKGQRCKKCGIEKNSGENHFKYNPNLTEEDRVLTRKYGEYREWRNGVFKRDLYTCQCCGDNKGGNLVAHHLDGHNWAKERRTVVSNGVTLCNPCHKDFHSEYGYGDNTETQFNEWLRNKRIGNGDLGA